MASLEEEPEAVVPRPVHLRQCTVLVGERYTPDPDFPVGVYEFAAPFDGCPNTSRISIIAVVEIEGRVVVAVPHSAWHRSVAKRKLPANCLTKPICLSLPFADRTAEEGAESQIITEKLWLGYLAPAHEDQILFDPSGEESETDIFFVSEESSILPTAQGLFDAVEQHFACNFSSAVSGNETPAAQVATLDSRLNQLETAISSLAQNFQKILPEAELFKGNPKAPPTCPPGLAATPNPPSQLRGLDAEVIQSARQAGVPEAQLEEMARLAGRGRPALPRCSLCPTQASCPREPVVRERGGCRGGQRSSGARRIWIGRSRCSSRPKAHEDSLPFIQAAECQHQQLGNVARRIRRSRLNRFPHQLVSTPCCCSTPTSEEFGIKSQEHLRDHREQHGRRLPECPADAGEHRRAGLISSMVGTEEPGAKLCNARQTSVGNCWSSRCSTTRSDRGVQSQTGLTSMPRRPTQHRQRQLGGSLGIGAGGSPSHDVVPSTPASFRSRASILKADRSSLDGAGPASSQRIRSTQREKEEAPEEASESRWPRRRCSKGRKGKRKKGQENLARGNSHRVGGPSNNTTSLTRPTSRPFASASLVEFDFENLPAPEEDNTASAAPSPGVAAQEGRKLPGAAASTVQVSSLWTSLVRWIMNGPRCAMRSFFHSSFQSRANKVKEPCNVGHVWPMPLPYPQIARQAAIAERAQQQALNCMVLVMNWLHLNQPSRAPRNYNLTAPLTDGQQQTVIRLSRLMEAWTKSGPISAADMGRSAGKVETIEFMIEKLTHEAVRLSKERGSGKLPQRVVQRATTESLLSEVQVAKPIEAERLKFGGTPGFSPVPFLDEATAAMYEKPLHYAMPAEESQETTPRVSVRGKRSEILSLLLRALDQGGRLALFPEEEVRVSHAAGLFALMKNLSVDRLIMDSRPANILEPAYGAWTQTMASIVPLLQMNLKAAEQLIVSGEDLRDFYYHFVISQNRARRNVLKFALTPAEAARFKAFETVKKGAAMYYPSLNTMAMGDRNAVEFGQQSHVHLCLALGLKLRDFITLRGSLPRQPWCIGVMIDDLVLIERVTAEMQKPYITTEIADHMVQAYESVKLQAHEAKRMRELTEAKFWGASLEGSSGLIRAQLERAVPISFITSQLCRLGWSSRKLLEIVAGAWVAILQYCRRAMCLIENIFHDISEHDYHEVFELKPETISELWSLVGLAPLFCTDLRAATATSLKMVDASDVWTAAVEAPISENLGEELERHQLTRTSWSKLLSPLRALQRTKGVLHPEDEVCEGEEPVRAHPAWTALARSLKFRQSRKKKIRRRTHINIDELHALLDAEKAHSYSYPNSRVAIGSDSQVVLGPVRSRCQR